MLTGAKDKLIKKRIRYNQGILAGKERDMPVDISDDLIAHGVAEEILREAGEGLKWEKPKGENRCRKMNSLK